MTNPDKIICNTEISTDSQYPAISPGKNMLNCLSQPSAAHRLTTHEGAFLCLLLCLTTIPGCASSPREAEPSPPGIAYQLREIATPRPNRIHVLRVDLADPRIAPVVVVGSDPDGDGPAETVLTDPRRLAADPLVLGFVNTNPWDGFPDAEGHRNRDWFVGQAVDIHGLAVTGGVPRSTATKNQAAVWFDADGRVHLGRVEETKGVIEGVHGFQMILSEGTLIVNPDGAIHPRTAIGLDEAQRYLYLVVVDGRQPGYSEGMTLHELGKTMFDIGCHTATNMDGGGSSVMGLIDATGSMRIMNRPSDRRDGKVHVRPLPMVLTLQRQQ